MKIQSNLKLVIVLVSIITFGSLTLESPLAAQSGTTGAPATQTSAPIKKLGFRVTQWKTIHTNSEEQAQTELETLKRIGCEVASENHGNHIDVRYQCTEWKTIKLATDQLVSQWANWCQAKGMETVIMQPPETTKLPTVRYRLTNPRTVHLHNKAEGDQILNTLELVGCSVTTNNHGDHMDATFSCPQWLTIELQTEDAAHSWQNWLRESGFETQHTHVSQ